MPRRAASPAMSENEVDIAGSLFAHDADSDDDNSPVQANNTPDDLDFGDILHTAADGDSDGDAAFIEMQQRRSNRRSANVQGKSVKKGGGFQAMGACLAPPL